MANKDNKVTKSADWEAASFEEKLNTVYVEVFKPMLVEKNNQYGNAALEPIDFLNIKPQAYGIIRSRLNEKLNRLFSLCNLDENEISQEELHENALAMEDTLKDISGYWFLQTMEVVRLQLQANELIEQSKNK